MEKNILRRILRIPESLMPQSAKEAITWAWLLITRFKWDFLYPPLWNVNRSWPNMVYDKVPEWRCFVVWKIRIFFYGITVVRCMSFGQRNSLFFRCGAVEPRDFFPHLTTNNLNNIPTRRKDWSRSHSFSLLLVWRVETMSYLSCWPVEVPHVSRLQMAGQY